jgi:hypothetical protein
MIFHLYPKKKTESGNAIDDTVEQSKQNMPLLEYKNKNISFNAIAVFRPEGKSDPVIYAAGSDKSIREITLLENGKTTEKRYEEGQSYSSIVVGY